MLVVTSNQRSTDWNYNDIIISHTEHWPILESLTMLSISKDVENTTGRIMNQHRHCGICRNVLLSFPLSITDWQPPMPTFWICHCVCPNGTLPPWLLPAGDGAVQASQRWTSCRMQAGLLSRENLAQEHLISQAETFLELCYSLRFFRLSSASFSLSFHRGQTYSKVWRLPLFIPALSSLSFMGIPSIYPLHIWFHLGNPASWKT